MNGFLAVSWNHGRGKRIFQIPLPQAHHLPMCNRYSDYYNNCAVINEVMTEATTEIISGQSLLSKNLFLR